ncbi:MAG: acyltransferase [Chloroflexi bacterium]|nr:acyltransferase [Chloroflexota bacterium]
MKIGLVQFAGKTDKAANIARGEQLIREAAAKGADIVCPHELMTTIYFCFTEDGSYFPLAEPIPGPATDRFSKVARELGVAIVLPLFEREGETDYYNSVAMLDSTGELLGVYRKNTIPHIRRNGVTPTGFEKYYFRPGDKGFPVWETAGGLKLGAIICFDRHFPEHFRMLALQGADLICVPTTSPRTGEKAWFFELQAAAFNNGVWIAGVNRVGLDEEGSKGDWFGRSVLISPRGEVVAQAGDREDEVLVADFDPCEAQELRATWGWFRDRRPEMYGALAH